MKLKKLTKKKKLLMIPLILLILLLLIVNNVFNGNPISKNLAKKKVQNYIAKTYPNTDFEIIDVFYNFKDTSYICDITSKSQGLKFSITEYANNTFFDQYAESDNGKYLINNDLSYSFTKTLSNKFENIIDNPNLETLIDILVFQSEYKGSNLEYDKSFTTPFFVNITQNFDKLPNEISYTFEDMVDALLKLKDYFSENDYAGFQGVYFTYYNKDDTPKSILITPDKLNFPNDQIYNLIENVTINCSRNIETGEIEIVYIDENQKEIELENYNKEK